MDEFQDWHFGFFLHQQWARQQAQELKADMAKVKETLKKIKA